MQLSGKIETYLLLRLERSILELRQQQLIDRETSARILKWIDGVASVLAVPPYRGGSCLQTPFFEV